MSTSPFGPLAQPLIQPLVKPLPGSSVVIDERNTNFFFDDPIGSLTVTRGGNGSSVYGHADVDQFVLKPYADNVNGWLTGDIEAFQATNVWDADLVLGGDVHDVHLEQFDYGMLSVYGNVDDVELFDSTDSSLAFYGHTDDVDVTWVDDTQLLFNQIGGVLELDGVADSTVEVGNANDAIIEIEDSRDLTVDIWSADQAELEIEAVDGLALAIGQGNVLLDGEEVANSNIATGAGHDSLYLEEITGTTIATGNGHDNVALQEADQVAVHTGGGNDFLSLTDQSPDAQVAYNLGEGRDFGYIAGGNTLGMLLDGESDTLVFNTAEGGDHLVVTDPMDQLYLQTANGGLWDADLVDFVDQGGQDGVAEWGDFSLTMITGSTPPADDLFLG